MSSLLDLPEVTLDLILNQLSPKELCRMLEVCVFLRDKCKSDDLWEKHLKNKWGRVIGEAVYKEWHLHVTKAKEGNHGTNNQNGSFGSFVGVWPNLYLCSYLQDSSLVINNQWSNHFMMSLFFSLERGRFWFPAQVYKGLVVHDALVRYDYESNTFQARYQHGGWRLFGNNMEWDMVRVPSVDSHPYVVHVSDCLDKLKPGNHIEIQWRGNTQSPYDWWYAVIGHLESCNKNENYCRCYCSDTIMVEFKQYPERSNMRRIKLSRKNGEQGDRAGGFYGGIRKLYSSDEIEAWKKLILLVTNLDRGFFMPPVAAQFPIH
ncbi:hypothetical protein KIW84_060403 [Lathyrus oleraceus]|uniref:F-box domain-containing protein n=2 Tax=Pisum sativum TaxID=3888 RepID=A0A9D4W038_PEA|nr:hypothetical protein KIW84_060403 [Pisum sativum]